MLLGIPLVICQHMCRWTIKFGRLFSGNYEQEAQPTQRDWASTMSIEIVSNAAQMFLQPVNDLQNHSRSITLVPFNRPHIVQHSKYVSILYRFKDINTYMPKF